jgi:hypothetical protein
MCRLRSILAFLAVSFINAVSRCVAAEPPPQWVVVVAPAFREAIQPLCEQRQKQGMQVTIIQSGDVLSAEELGSGDGRKLRRHLNQICRAAKGTSYILLVGSAVQENPKEVAATVIPPLQGTISRMKGQPSDNGYGCLNDDQMPTIAVGRLPAKTDAQARGMVDKILTFERGERREKWGHRMKLFIGDPNGNSGNSDPLANFAATAAIQLSGERIHPAWDVGVIMHVPVSQFYLPDSYLHDKALEMLEEGEAFTFYLGHSGAWGFASGQGRFLDRQDFAHAKIPYGGGIFVTCGCWACQLWGDGGEGFGLAAIRNPTGPAAVVGAHGESYAAAGQLAFEGLLQCFATPRLPPRLGDCWLKLKGGLAGGEMGLLTFKMFDESDGSHGTIPLEVQRREHLEMWMLLGDPAMQLPVAPAEIRLEGPKEITAGRQMTIRGALPDGLGDGPVVLTLQRPRSSAPSELQPLPAGPPEARAKVIVANFARANQFEILSRQVQAHQGKFDVLVNLPEKLPWPKITVRASAVRGDSEALGVITIPVK